MNVQIRQGDVFLQPAGKINLNGAKPVKPVNGRLVLAEGEVTGHAHTIDAACANLFELTGKRVLVVSEPTTITHQEHGELPIAPGTYWQLPQREWDESARRVID
jgi:hypothetical protein